MSKFRLVLEIEPVDLGGNYEHIPMHCTVIPWFYVREDINTVTSKVENIFLECAPIELLSVGSAFFGINNNIPVHILEKNASLMYLHNLVYETLLPMVPSLAGCMWIGENYNPHVTSRGGNVFAIGSRYSVTCMYIVKKKRLLGSSKHVVYAKIVCG